MSELSPEGAIKDGRQHGVEFDSGLGLDVLTLSTVEWKRFKVFDHSDLLRQRREPERELPQSAYVQVRRCRSFHPFRALLSADWRP